jgi:hypothetical protein
MKSDAMRICCNDFLRSRVSRRSALQIGGLGLGGLSLPQLLRAEEQGAYRKPTAKSVIMLFMFGGASHHDTFDMKPDAPAEIRGEFKQIATNVPGIDVCELLPNTAKIADKYALVRSVHHDRSSHNPGAYYSLTGRRPLINRVTANASATDFPHPGSIVDYLIDSRPDVPTFVSLPTMIADGPFRTPGEFAGFLGKQFDPLFITKDPNSSDFSVEDLMLPETVSVARVNDRRAILEQLDATSRLADKAAVQGMDAYRQRAYALLTSPATRKALAIDEEDAKVRDRYGRTTYGQSCLMARRLVEAGVRFVTVYYSRGIGGWDTHKNNFRTLKGSRLPQTDQTLPALLEDLDERGLLDETLVYWTGDFGRTPKINKDAGRDHWPPCQTVLMSGGGISGGRVHGASDREGAYPVSNPHLPDDITATAFHALGLNPKTLIHDQLLRPMPISAGSPIEPLFG